MQLQVGTVGLQGARYDVPIDKASVVLNDDVCKWRDDRGTPLGAHEVTLLVGDRASPRELC